MTMNEWVQNWISDLTKPDSVTGIPLCPFAQKAWDQGHVKVVNTDNLWNAVHAEIENFGEHRLVMCIQDEITHDYASLEAACSALNRWFSFTDKDIWLLSSQMNRDIVFIQRLSELDAASVALEKLGYYDAYDKEDYERLIGQRRLLRRGTQQ